MYLALRMQIAAIILISGVALADEVKLAKDQSFVDQVPPKTIALTYHGCNLMQRAPVLDKKTGKYVGVRIFGTDFTPRTFIDCNLINVDVPIGSVVQKSNWNVIQYDVADGKESIVTAFGTVEAERTGMRVLGRYTAPGKIERVENPVVLSTDSGEDEGETKKLFDDTKRLVEEREALVKRISEIDATLKVRVVPIKPEVVK